MKRVVLDTNVVVSSLLFGKRPGELVSLWKKGHMLPLCSKPMVQEILRVLAYPKFDGFAKTRSPAAGNAITY
jgi:uncharacterized protein